MSLHLDRLHVSYIFRICRQYHMRLLRTTLVVQVKLLIRCVCICPCVRTVLLEQNMTYEYVKLEGQGYSSKFMVTEGKNAAKVVGPTFSEGFVVFM